MCDKVVRLASLWVYANLGGSFTDTDMKCKIYRTCDVPNLKKNCLLSATEVLPEKKEKLVSI